MPTFSKRPCQGWSQNMGPTLTVLSHADQRLEDPGENSQVLWVQDPEDLSGVSAQF